MASEDQENMRTAQKIIASMKQQFSDLSSRMKQVELSSPQRNYASDVSALQRRVDALEQSLAEARRRFWMENPQGEA